MTVSRLRDIPGIGVDKVGDAADAAADPRFLRLENLDTDLRPRRWRWATRTAVDRDDANSYLPFQGHLALREAACGLATAATGHSYDPRWMAGGPAAAGTCAWSSPTNPSNGSPTCAPASTPH